MNTINLEGREYNFDGETITVPMIRMMFNVTSNFNLIKETLDGDYLLQDDDTVTLPAKLSMVPKTNGG